MTYYDQLEVTSRASAETIKAAYHSLAKTCHPDLHPGNKVAEEMFKVINAAYQVLSDPAKRAAYDAQLATQRPQAIPFPVVDFSQFDGASAYPSAYPDALSNIVGGAAQDALSAGLNAMGAVFVDSVMAQMPPHLRVLAKQALANAAKQTAKKKAGS